MVRDAKRTCPIITKWGCDFVCLVTVISSILFFNVRFVTTTPLPFEHAYHATLSGLYPSIFFAAGHGLITTDVEELPGLADFIYREAQTFDISIIPDDLAGRPMVAPAATTHIYYVYVIGWMWWLFGVSANTLVKYAFLIRIVSAIFIYCVLRIALKRHGALICSFVICTTPAMIFSDISLRDIGKAPFFLAFLFVIAYITIKNISSFRFLFSSLLLGFVLGFGLGFRQDLLICLPPAFIVLCCFARVKGSYVLLQRCLAVFLLFSVFLCLSWPIFRAAMLEGNQQTSAHTFLVGMSQNIERELRFGHASYDALPASFSGEAISYAVINSYARRNGMHESMVNPHSAEYQRFMGDKTAHLLIDPYFFFNGRVYAEAGRLVVRDLIRFFPADFVARAWCSVAAVFQGPHYYSRRILETKGTLPNWMNVYFLGQDLLARHVADYGLAYTMAVLIVLAAFQFRLALFYTIMFFWFAGYPSIQFEYRHSFHLVFIPIMAMALCIEYPIRWFLAWRRGESVFSQAIRSYVLGSLLLVLLVGAAFALPLQGLRIWQSAQLLRLADKIDAAPLEPIPVLVAYEAHQACLKPAYVLPGLTHAETLPAGETAWEYIALTFNTNGFDIPVTIHYDESRLLNNFTQTITIKGVHDGYAGKVTLFCPIYETDTTYSLEMLPEFLRTFPAIAARIDDPRPIPEQDWWRRSKFLGVSFPEKYLGLFEGFYVVRNIEDIRLLPIFQIPEDRRFLRLYKTGPWERRLRDAIAMRWAGTDEEVSPAINNDFWQLDERLLYHPPSEIFSGLLLSQMPGNDYVTEWRERVAYLPELSKTAAFDLANAGTIWRNNGLMEDAISAYRAACEFDLDGPLYRVRLGQLLEYAGAVEEAWTQYMGALKLQSLLPDTAEKVDALFLAKGQRAEQRLFWKQVSDLHPDCWFSGMRAGNLFETDELFEAAADLYDRVHHAHPQHPDTRLALARCRGRTGRYLEAIELILETAATHPEYQSLVVSHLETLGEYLSGEGAYLTAEEAFSRLVEIMPDNPNYWMRLGDVRVQNGRIESGLDAYAHALRLAEDSDSALQETIRQRLEATNPTSAEIPGAGLNDFKGVL